ncbi:MAG: hypothetical protein QNJ98_06930 [Planctomycetota bacterium]|nr:hypothetical protein [Planctomycetota bacterium]
MRSLNRQRGSVNWPFVIVLIALLAFIYMWWNAQDQKDDNLKTIEDQKGQIEDLRAIANARGEELKTVSNIVGFKKIVAGNDALGVDQATSVDVARLAPHLNDQGMVAVGDTQANGTLKELIEQAYLTYQRERRTGSPKAEAKDFKYATMSDALKSKLAEISQFEVPAAPIPDHDPDDSAAAAEYEAAKNNHDQAIAAWHKLFDEAASMDGFKEWAETITNYAVTDPNAEDLIKVTFMKALPEQTVEEFLNAVRGVPQSMREEFAANKQADVAEIQRLTGILAQKETNISELNKNLKDQEDQYATDLTAKDSQIGDLQQQVSDANLEKQTAQNALAAEKESRRKDVARLSSELDARKEALRILKQTRDLIVRRDDPDGDIVAANNTLRTAIINLGFNDKVYVGQRFNVSALDRVGDRVAKGMVMVTKVTGNSSARCRIVSMTAPLTQGDFIHNPFYSPNETINVFFAGPITKWPATMAKQRLASINVNLQSAINGDTDYIVIPNAWVVAEQAKAEGGDEDEDADEEDMGAKSPIEAMQNNARKVGAEVISESLFDAFLNY